MNCNPNTDSNNPSTNLAPDSNDDRIDNQSTTSSTDDYVRELLDPNDRPRNVWHVVEGPKIEPDGDGRSDGDTAADNYDGDNINNGNNDNRPKTSPLPSPPPPPPPPPPEDDENTEAVAPEQDRRHEEEPGLERQSPHSVGDRASDRGHNERSSSSRHRRHREDEHRDHRDRRDRHRGRDRERDRRETDLDKQRNRDRDRDRGHRRDRRRDDHDQRSSRRRRDYSDDDDDRDSYHRHRSDRRHGSSSSRRDRSGSRTASSLRRRDRSRSNSHSPLTKRNSRTILIMQLNSRVTSEDLEDFFAGVGKVKEVRLIIDSKTRKHKGIAYIEFEDASTAAKAFSLNGQEFFGAPINIQSAHSDRIRSSSDWHSSSTSHTSAVNYHHHASTHSSSRSNLPPNCYRVYVGGLHVNLTEEMLRSLFEPFGPIVRLELMRDRATNISRGYAFITYANTEDGQEAVRCLDGFELAGKPMRVSKSTDKSERHTNTDSINAG